MPLPTAYGTIPLGGALPEAYVPDQAIPLLGGALESGYGEVSYAVNMTAAASGSNGITVADDDDIDFGTGDFFLHWEGSLPDWTPSAVQILAIKRMTDGSLRGWSLSVNTTSALRFYLRNFASTTLLDNVLSTSLPTVTDGGSAKVTIVCVRETATVDGSLTFYFNGAQLGTPIAIPAQTVVTVSNAEPLYLSGTSTTRTASNTISCIVGNFAPTASEVLELCVSGIPANWLAGGQREAYASNFSAGSDTWTGASGTSVSGNNDGIDGENDWLRLQVASAIELRAFPASFVSAGVEIAVTNIKIHNPNAFTAYVGVFVTRTVSALSGNASDVFVTLAPGETKTLSSTALPSIGGGISVASTDSAGNLAAMPGAGSVYIKSVTVEQIMTVMALLPEDIPTSSATTWSDTSGNTGGGTLPAAGATKVTIRR